jgi:(p)ppGpp synthase/HD superfamily hydrolase
MNNLIARAMLFAEHAHRGQARKYTSGPYIEHPRRVAAHAAFLGLSDVAIAAAFLHDVHEDCDVTLATLHEEFGTAVMVYVDMLSDMQTPEDGNRKQRKKAYRDRLREFATTNELAATPTCNEVITLKAIDIIDNARSIAGEDPKFWKTVRVEFRDFFIDLGDWVHRDLHKHIGRLLEVD